VPGGLSPFQSGQIAVRVVISLRADDLGYFSYRRTDGEEREWLARAAFLDAFPSPWGQTLGKAFMLLRVSFLDSPFFLSFFFFLKICHRVVY
jgi:hypothetical protein